MKAKKKLNVSTNIIVDFAAKDISEGLLQILLENDLCDYKDRILKEDIYPEAGGLKERILQEIPLTKGEELELDGIERIMRIKKAAYFRIIF